MRLQREVTVYYQVHITRDEAIDLLRDNEVDVAEDLPDDELLTLLIDSANDDWVIGDSLDDWSSETDSGSGPWEPQS